MLQVTSKIPGELERYVTDAGGKDTASSPVYSLPILRCQSGQKFPLSSPLSSFVTVCTDGRDIIETADKGMKVFDTGQSDFL